MDDMTLNEFMLAMGLALLALGIMVLMFRIICKRMWDGPSSDENTLEA